jgi:hypothetical protein
MVTMMSYDLALSAQIIARGMPVDLPFSMQTALKQGAGVQVLREQARRASVEAERQCCGDEICASCYYHAHESLQALEAGDCLCPRAARGA